MTGLFFLAMVVMVMVVMVMVVRMSFRDGTYSSIIPAGGWLG